MVEPVSLRSGEEIKSDLEPLPNVIGLVEGILEGARSGKIRFIAVAARGAHGDTTTAWAGGEYGLATVGLVEKLKFELWQQIFRKEE